MSSVAAVRCGDGSLRRDRILAIRAGGRSAAEARKSVAPLLLGQTKESPHAAHYYYSGYKLEAVRAGAWKLAIASQKKSMGMDGPAAPASLDQPRLYNLDTDIGEQNDVAAKNPEVVAKLKALAVKMAAELGDGKAGPEVRPPGRVENPVTLYPSLATPKKPAQKIKTGV